MGQSIMRARRGGALSLVALIALSTGTAHAQLDGFIQGLIRPPPPAPPAYPYYPPAYPSAPPPGYYRPYYPPAYAPVPAPSAPRATQTVADAQRMLGELGYPVGQIDGVSGPRLAEAIRAFQRDRNRKEDGRLGADTSAAISAAWRERATAGAKPAPEPDPKLAAADPAPSPASEGSSATPTEGKYCRFGPASAYDMLLVRDNGQLAADFGLSLWLPNGNNFALSGSAFRDGAVWRFESGMRSRDPAEHCRATLERLSDGGWRFATAQEARCSSSGGNNAAPLEPLVFPAASRMGNPPTQLGGETLMRVGCDRSRSGTAGAAEASSGLLFSAPASAGGETGTAEIYVTCRTRANPRRSTVTLTVNMHGIDRFKNELDLDAIEGPYPHSTAKIRLQVTSRDGEGSLAGRFPAAGTRIDAAVMQIPLEEDAGRAAPASLARILAALAAGPGRLSWLLDNPTPGGPPLEVALPVSQADAASLAQSLRSCLPR